ncbi:hypothetical protein F4777DRAFT_23081 [Nemania sp. FL0916]|nr:hypothetical protein F4777DRAFT_23081 [Nemania sp. FL0916]
MGTQEQEHESQVQLSLSLRTTAPHSISITDPNPASPLKLICSLKQTASPYPERAVTILTKYTCLDTTPTSDAFFIQAMSSPKLITTSEPKQEPEHEPEQDSERGDNKQRGGPAPELPLRPVSKRIHMIRVSGDPDLLKRDKADGFTFLIIPPTGQGEAEVVFELPPSELLKRLGEKEDPLEDKMARFLRKGTEYRITPSDLEPRWWAFGGLGDDEESWDEDGYGDKLRLLRKGKRIARWTLPDSLPLVRDPSEDETDEIANKLVDLVDLHDVNHLSSRSAVDGEQKPVIGNMRKEGWVFGEPSKGLVIKVEEGGEERRFGVVE